MIRWVKKNKDASKLDSVEALALANTNVLDKAFECIEIIAKNGEKVNQQITDILRNISSLSERIIFVEKTNKTLLSQIEVIAQHVSSMAMDIEGNREVCRIVTINLAEQIDKINNKIRGDKK